MIIGLIGEHDPARETQSATVAAIEHSSRELGLECSAEWVPTRTISRTLLESFDGLWIAPGCKYLDQGKVVGAIRWAREERRPCIGTCGGFQHMVLEYARNTIGLSEAQSEEYDAHGDQLLITQLRCSLRGREMALRLKAGSRAHALYGAADTSERYYCSLGVNPDFRKHMAAGPMLISGEDMNGEIRIIEWPEHPFFLGTLFVPQTKSTATNPHPVVTGFLRAAMANSELRA